MNIDKILTDLIAESLATQESKNVVVTLSVKAELASDRVALVSTDVTPKRRFVRRYKRPSKRRYPSNMRKDPWTEEEVSKLIGLREQGVGFVAIAKAVGRTRRACETRFSIIKLEKQKAEALRNSLAAVPQP